MAKADIIVLTCGQTPFTLRCFNTIRKHTNDYNLVWVDNGSPKESREEVMEEAIKHPVRRTMWVQENKGFVGGVNIALNALFNVWRTDSKYVVLLNNDVEVTDGWLERMISVMERDPVVGAVGPITSECKSWQSFENVNQVLPVFQEPPDFRHLGTDQRGARMTYCYSDLYRLCNMVAFFCTVFRREVFEKVGFLDPAFGVGLGDDDDFCKRMKEKGMLCAVSMGTYVFHNHRTTFKANYSFSETEELSKTHKEVFRQKHGHDARVEAL